MNERGYSINPDVKYGPFERIDVPAVVAETGEKWFNQTLARVNESVVRLGIVEGEFHWHEHRSEDEFFFVLSGRLLVDLEGRTVELGPQQGVTVPKGVPHRTRAPEKTVMLMVEGSGIRPTGDEPAPEAGGRR